MGNLTFSEMNIVEMDACVFLSVGVPDGYEAAVDQDDCNVTIHPVGRDDVGAGVSVFALEHPWVSRAKETGEMIHIGSDTWYMYTEVDSDGVQRFQVILERPESAISVRGSVKWSKLDIIKFLEAITFTQ